MKTKHAKHIRKILFLDIDNVLNSSPFNLSGGNTNQYNTHKLDLLSDTSRLLKLDLKCLDPSKIDLLNQTVKETNCDIVISSTWRKQRRLVDLLRVFRVIGFKYWENIIDVTPTLSHSPRTKTSVPRGAEVYEWLIVNKGLLGEKVGHYKNYCIVDDRSDFLINQINNFVQTNRQTGITTEHRDKIIEILNKDYERVK